MEEIHNFMSRILIFGDVEGDEFEDIPFLNDESNTDSIDSASWPERLNVSLLREQ
jgi:hypothetical protein